MRVLSRRNPVLLALSLAACTNPAATDAGSAAPAARAGVVDLSQAAAGAAAYAGSAGMDCSKAASAAEQAICADPVLIGLDTELGTAWTAALARSDDRDALLADQRRWLQQRAECVGKQNERGCLRSTYATRTAVLHAVQGGAFAWAGKWIRIGGSAGFELTPAANHHFAFKLDAAAGGHTGGIEAGSATPADPRTLRASAADSSTAPCRLELRRVANQIELVEIDSAFDCGAAMGVAFAGRYVRDDAGAPALKRNLLTLDLATDAAADARVRELLGKDGYTALIERCQMISQDEQTPDVATCGVRGLYTVMEAALQQQGETVRVAQIEDKEVRYWSSDPATRSAPPAWFDAWRKNFADKPVRLMSVAGTPLRTSPLQQGARGD